MRPKKALSELTLNSELKVDDEAKDDDDKEELNPQQPFDESTLYLDQQNDSQIMALKKFQTEKRSLQEEEIDSHQIIPQLLGQSQAESFLAKEASIEVTN